MFNSCNLSRLQQQLETEKKQKQNLKAVNESNLNRMKRMEKERAELLTVIEQEKEGRNMERAQFVGTIERQDIKYESRKVHEL